MTQLMRSIVWSGDRAVNQPWGCTTYTAEPWYAALGCFFHCGIDIAFDGGEPLNAARAGHVLAVGQGFLAIQVGTEMDWYLHCSRYVVSRGQNVASGQLIGYAGSVAPPGGSSSGPHLHFERQSTLALFCNIPATSRDPVPVLDASHSSEVQGVSGNFQGVTDVEHASYVGADGNFYHGWRNCDPATSTTWTWENLGAPTGKTCADSAEWLADAKVHIQIVRVRTADGGLWCRYSIADSSNPSWAPWVSMGNVEPATGSPAPSDADVPADLSALTQAAQNAHDVATEALVTATAAQAAAIKVETAVLKAGSALQDA